MRVSLHDVPDPELVIRLAEHSYCGPLRSETKDAVCTLMECMLSVDDYVDSAGDDRAQAVKNILAYLSEEKSEPAIQGEAEVSGSLLRLKDILNFAPFERKKAFLNKAERLFQNGEILSNTKDPSVFLSERMDEAKNAADMILILANELGDNPEFAELFRAVTISQTLLDSLIDAPKDNARGKIALKPVQIYFGLVKGVVEHGVAFVNKHPNKPALAELGYMGLSQLIGWRPNSLQNKRLSRKTL